MTDSITNDPSDDAEPGPTAGERDLESTDSSWEWVVDSGALAEPASVSVSSRVADGGTDPDTLSFSDRTGDSGFRWVEAGADGAAASADGDGPVDAAGTDESTATAEDETSPTATGSDDAADGQQTGSSGLFGWLRSKLGL